MLGIDHEYEPELAMLLAMVVPAPRLLLEPLLRTRETVPDVVGVQLRVRV